MVGCSILRCNNRSDIKGSGISFHRFPLDKTLANIWIAYTGRKNWVPKAGSRICSVHFEHDMFQLRNKSKILKPTAVPTKFLNPGDTDIKTKKKQILLSKVKKEPVESTSSSSCDSQKFRKTENAVVKPRNIRKQTLTSGVKIEPVEYMSDEQESVTYNLPPSQINAIKIEDTVVEPKRKEMFTFKVWAEPVQSTSSNRLETGKDNFSPSNMFQLLRENRLRYNQNMNKMKAVLERQKAISTARLKKLRAQQQSNRRLQKKMTIMSLKMCELKAKLFASGDLIRPYIPLVVMNED